MQVEEDSQSVKGQGGQVKSEPDPSENYSQKLQNEMEYEEIRSVEDQSESSDQSRLYKRQKHQLSEEKDNCKTIQLDQQILEGIVRCCKAEDLISEEMYHAFSYNHSSQLDLEYIRLFYKNQQLETYDFSRSMINIIDHRRLVQLLIRHKPNKYVLVSQKYEPQDYIPEVREFLSYIYSLPLTNYDTMIERQVNQYFQWWWGGPKYISPVVDPPVRFCQTEEGKKLREEKENTIRIESNEQEKQRLKRVNQQRATNNDLMDIAKIMSNKLYGSRPPNQAKLQNSQDSGVSSSGRSSVKKKKGKKQKKIKKEKKDKKDKKDKKKKDKKKKMKKQKQIKKQDNEQSSKLKQEDTQSQTSNKKNKKKKPK